jgi:small-conductance mechanosensitive channel
MNIPLMKGPFFKIALFVTVTICIVEMLGVVFKIFMKRNNSIHLRFLRSILKVIIISISTYLLLQQFDTTKNMSGAILKSSSLIIAVVTFATQQILGNILNGIIISSTKPFNVGDKIQLKNDANIVFVTGRVETMNLYHIRIRDYNGNTNIVSNSKVQASTIVNMDYHDRTNVQDTVVVAGNTNWDLVEYIIIDIILDEELTINTVEDTRIEYMFGDYGVVLQYNVRTNDIEDSYSARSNITRKILIAFDENNIKILFKK